MDREGEGTRRLALGLALAVLVTVGGGMVLSRWADEGAVPETVGATGQPAARAAATTGVPTSAPPDGPTPTTEGPTGPASTTAPARSATTAATGASTSTTVPPAADAPTTTSPDPRDSAADGPPGPVCNSTMFDTRLTLDRTTFRPGETVRGTATFSNVSGNTCYWASTTGKVEVLDSSGRSVGPLPAVIRDGFHWVPFTPGEVFTQHPSWDQEACPPSGLPLPCGQAPPGTYTMVVTEEPYGVARATFQLVAG